MSKRVSNKKLGELLKRLYPEKYIKSGIEQALTQALTKELNGAKITMSEGTPIARSTIEKFLNKNRDLFDFSAGVEDYHPVIVERILLKENNDE